MFMANIGKGKGQSFQYYHNHSICLYIHPPICLLINFWSLDLPVPPILVDSLAAFESVQITNLVCIMVLSFTRVCCFITACLVVRSVLTGMFCTRLVWQYVRYALGDIFLEIDV